MVQEEVNSSLEADTWYSILLFVILLICSGFFSGSESAFFSLTQSDLNDLKNENKSRNAKRVLRLLRKQKRLLATILIGNTVVNVAAATVAAFWVAQNFPAEWMATWGVVVQVGVVTLVILVFSEVSPKVFAVRHALSYAKHVSVVFVVLTRLFYPFSSFVNGIIFVLSKIFRIKKETALLTESELKTLFDVGVEKGALDATEREMIHSIFEFRETLVKEVMVPRMDMVCIEKVTPIEDVLQLVKEKGHSRIPVYDEKVDNILGVLVVKDLLPYMNEDRKVPEISSLLRKVYYVPESKRIDDLLREFQEERMHLAIVVDEYGGTAGLVTLEDVIEEIVGEIRDEYDREKPLLRKINGNTWVVDAKINIEDLNEELELTIPTSEEFESLGGFIFSQLRSIPEENEELQYENLRLIVEKVDGQRIQNVKLIIESTQEPT